MFSPQTFFFPDASLRLLRDLHIMQKMQDKGMPRLARMMSRLLQRRYSVFISPTAKLGKNVRFPHPTGIVIGEGVVVANDAIIYQNVTLGGRRIGDAQKGHYPEIGAGTVIFAGAVVAGKVRIGRGCTIGANSVVLHDMPDNAIVAGAPARVIG